MSSSRHSSRRPALPGGKSASQARRQFAPLAEKLQAARSVAAAWENAHDEAERLARAELAPLSASVDRRLKELLLLLDREHGSEALDEEERVTLSGFIFDGAIELLDEGDDPELEALCDRHAGEPPYDDEDDEDEDEDEDDRAGRELRAMLSEALGEEIDENIDLATPEGRSTILELLEEDEQMERARAERRLAAIEQANDVWASDSKRIEEIVQALSARLGVALEAAPAQDLLQRARSAQEAGDLAGLLEVQFEAEQLGLAERLSEKQLAECVKLLKEELKFLERETAAMESEAARILGPGGDPAQRLLPGMLLIELGADIEELKEQDAQLQRDLATLHNPAKLKAWIRALDDFGDDPD
ncbi:MULTISPECIES: hypothetical protein [unclassified Massilia]|uniref:hypothetical protein n=1 Tax=unclassified Massilia TaxID=2609279 RepID=UPI001B80F8D7|nr:MULTISPECIES: hypothetical protein [unclassified Massilia]MBQ5940765.1 hypothetical protein [Massilia sp. AB1]MBQ5965310.1 hypothetical protein [Massilia sp. ZL223]